MSTLAGAFDAALLDLDGTLYEGEAAIEGAHAALTAAGLPMVYITNNASRPPQVVADQLVSLGYDARAEDVLTSAQAAIELASELIEPGSTVYVLGAASFAELARQAGYTVTDSADDDVAAVFQGLNREMTWKQMSEAALAISRGATYIASNLDTTLPDERGFLVGNGSVAAALTTTTGVAPLSAGKPKPPMFHAAAKRLGAQAPLAIGDRLDTDIAGGNAAGFATLLVLTGVSTHLDVVNAPAPQRPRYVAATMAGLGEPAQWATPGPQAGLSARIVTEPGAESGSEPGAEAAEVVVLSGGDAADSRLADSAQAAAAALLTIVDVVWSRPDNAPAITQVRAEGALAEAALKAWRG